MRGVAALVVLLMLLGGPSARAGEPDVQAGPDAVVGWLLAPPDGWAAFCAESPLECTKDGVPSKTDRVHLTDAAWVKLKEVNIWVNDAIRPMSDRTHWGVEEKWSLPSDGWGDCEDLALLKRKMLVEAGWPRSALLITVVRDRKDELHVVLTARTDHGEFVLDSENWKVLPWRETGYRFLGRQSQADPNVWVSLEPEKSSPVEARADAAAMEGRP